MRDTYDVNTCRMFSKMSTLKNFGIILAVFFCQLQHDYAIPTLSICNSPENGRNCILECLETNLSSAVRFEHPLSTPQGTCLSASLCFSTNYNIYQNGNITFLNISELDRSRDEGQWYCFHGTQNDSQKLVVPSAIVSQIQPVVKVSKSDLKITCKMPCQYPVESLSVDVIYAIKDSSTYSIFPSRPTIINVTEFTNDVACDLKETNYQADLTYTKSSSTNFLEGKTLTVKCNITQSLIPSSSGDTGISSKEFDFTIKDVETTTTRITTEGSTTATTTTYSTNKSTHYHSSSSSSATTSASSNSISVQFTMQSPNRNGFSKKSYTTYIIIGSVGGSALIVLLCVVAVVFRRKFTSKSDSSQKNRPVSDVTITGL